MKICCVSDLHGYTPEIPDCDLLILGGDYQTQKYGWMQWRDVYVPWINDIAERGIKVIGVAGNHDWMFIRERDNLIRANWTYLQDSGCEFNGLNIWGSPWQPRFFDWAFNLDESELELKWNLIPDNTDVLVLHGPPHGFGDLSPYSRSGGQYERTGSPSLTKRIKQISPKLVVCGHIHSGYGMYMCDDTMIVNAAQVNEQYQLTNKPVLVEIRPIGYIYEDERGF